MPEGRRQKGCALNENFQVKMNRHLIFSFGFSITRQREIRYTARYPRDRAKVRLSGVVNVNLAASVKLVNRNIYG